MCVLSFLGGANFKTTSLGLMFSLGLASYRDAFSFLGNESVLQNLRESEASEKAMWLCWGREPYLLFCDTVEP